MFVVGEDDQGRWTVHNNRGLLEGTFTCHEDALLFARSIRLRYPTALLITAPARIRAGSD